MKIAVLAGGLSPEREVSLCSGSLIANSLSRTGNKVVLLDVYLGADVYGDIDDLFTDNIEYSHEITEVEPDLVKLKAESGNGDALLGKNVIEICRHADVVFLALHGAMGENGQLQAALDCYGIHYTGSGYIGSLLAMDKDISKKLLSSSGVVTADSITVTADDDRIDDICEKIGFPCVVKPCSCGSSVGVSIVHDPDELTTALGAAFAFENRVLVEKKISGRELTVGILEGKPLPPVEIIPKSGFYDYKNKYQAGMTEEICPPDITSDEQKLLFDAALKTADILRLGSYSRVDFILSSDDGKTYCLEANTLPGMTPVSLLPREAAAAGISYDDLCSVIARSALK